MGSVREGTAVDCAGGIVTAGFEPVAKPAGIELAGIEPAGVEPAIAEPGVELAGTDLAGVKLEPAGVALVDPFAPRLPAPDDASDEVGSSELLLAPSGTLAVLGKGIAR